MDSVPIRCILPHNRHVAVRDGLVLGSAAEPPPLSGYELRLTSSDNAMQLLTLPRLGELMGFEYSPRLMFLHERDLREWLLNSIDMVEFRSSKDLGVDRLINEGQLIDSLSVRFVSDVIGHGLFITRDATLNEFIGEYTGLVTSPTCQDSKNTEGTAYSVEYPSMTGGYAINAKDHGNLMRFINHSSSPNARFICLSHEDGLVHVVCVSNRNVLLNVDN